MTKKLKKCPFCGKEHGIFRISTVYEYDKYGNPVLDNYHDAVSLEPHGYFMSLEDWESRPLEDELNSKLEDAKGTLAHLGVLDGDSKRYTSIIAQKDKEIAKLKKEKEEEIKTINKKKDELSVLYTQESLKLKARELQLERLLEALTEIEGRSGNMNGWSWSECAKEAKKDIEEIWKKNI